MSNYHGSLVSEIITELQEVIAQNLEAFKSIKELLASGDFSEAIQNCEIQISKLEKKL